MQKKNSTAKKPTKRTARRKVDIDLVAEHEKFVKVAKQVEQLFNNSPGIPDFLTNAMMNALSEAAKSKRVTIWKEMDGGEDFDVEALADLFVLSQSLDIEMHNNAAARADFEAEWLAENELQIHNPIDLDPEWVELSNAIAKIATSDVAPWALKIKPRLPWSVCSQRANQTAFSAGVAGQH
jgi:hypothetical protein